MRRGMNRARASLDRGQGHSSCLRLHGLPAGRGQGGKGPAGFCLNLAWRGHIELCVSQEILDEVADVLARPRVRERFPALDDGMVEAFLAAVRARSRFFSSVPRRLSLSRDPKDEP